MTNEEKVLLLSSLIGEDTSKYINSYIEEIVGSPYYLKLTKMVEEAKTVPSLRGEKLINDFEMINFNNIKTLKDVFIFKTKILYLVNEFLQKEYVNPLLYNDEFKDLSKVGDLIVTFDNRKMTLTDLILDERYTTDYKLDYVKNLTDDYKREVDELITNPLMNLKKKTRNGTIKLFSFDYRFSEVVLVIINIFMALSVFTMNDFILAMFANEVPVFISAIGMLTVVVLILLDASVLLTSDIRKRKHYWLVEFFHMNYYSFSFISRINNKSRKFYEYLTDCILNRKIPTKRIRYLTISSRRISYGLHALNIYNSNDEEVEIYGELTMFSKLLIFILIALIITLVIIYLIWSNI